MGNKNSHDQKSQKHPAKGEFINRQEESDEGDDIDSDNIQLEVETYECLIEESEDEVINHKPKSCKSESDHERYTLVEDLIRNTDKNASLQILPEAIRHDSVLEFIKIHEKLVVRIRTKVRGKTGQPAPASEEKSIYGLFGTGCVYLTSDKLIRNENCSLHDCSYNNGQKHENYGGLIVYTNKHVIENHWEAGCCNVDFFYYNEKSLIDTDEMTGVGSFLLESGATNSSGTGVDNSEQRDGSSQLDSSDNDHFIDSGGLPKGITAYGVALREVQENKDLVGLRIFYHDPRLFDLINTLSNLRMIAWSKIPEEIKRKMRKYVIIISHPHGWPKKISFGDLISLEEPSRNQKSTKVTKYNATTCTGSSGAPVVIGHYSYRPFVHTAKNLDTKLGFSQSY